MAASHSAETHQTPEKEERARWKRHSGDVHRNRLSEYEVVHDDAVGTGVIAAEDAIAENWQISCRDADLRDDRIVKQNSQERQTAVERRWAFLEQKLARHVEETDLRQCRIVHVRKDDAQAVGCRRFFRVGRVKEQNVKRRSPHGREQALGAEGVEQTAETEVCGLIGFLCRA